MSAGGPTNAAEPPSPRSSPLGFLLRRLRRHRAELALALTWSILFVVVPMQVPLFTGALVSGLTGTSATLYGLVTLTGQTEIVRVTIAALIGVAVAYGVTSYLAASSTAELSRMFVRDVRKDMIARLDRSSLDVHRRFGSGELMSRVMSDTESTRNFVQYVFFTNVQSVVRIVYPVAMLLLLDPWVALVTAAVLPAQWLVTRRFQTGLRRATRTARTTRGRLMASVKENLDGIETIQTSNAEGPAIARVGRETDQLAQDQIDVRTYTGLINGSTGVFTSIGVALAWGLGGMQVLAGSLTLGVLVTVTGYVVLLYMPVRAFTRVTNVYQRGTVALERIQEVLEVPSPIRDDPRAPPLRIPAGRIEFRDVSFGYDARRSLRAVNLVIEPGSVTALVGRNGSGKSTLLKLVSRLFDPTDGTVLIDGQDLRNVRLESLRRQVAVVPQSPVLFSGTIEENIRIGRPEASSTEVATACEQAGVLDYIAHQPRGLSTVVGPGGVSLSGGEVQRLSIARALLRAPRILLLDEPNSALDRESEERLAEAVGRLRGRVTVLLVAHHMTRLMREADCVILLENGAVAAPPGPGVGDESFGPLASALAGARRREMS